MLLQIHKLFKLCYQKLLNFNKTKIQDKAINERWAMRL